MSGSLPDPREIIAAHEEIEDEYDLKYTGARVAAPRLDLQEIVEGAAEYSEDELYLRAAYLLRKVLTAHIFEDGNKRTAWITAREYLDRHGETPAETGEGAERVLRRIRRYDIDEIAKWLETGELDRERLEP